MRNPHTSELVKREQSVSNALEQIKHMGQEKICHACFLCQKAVDFLQKAHGYKLVKIVKSIFGANAAG